MSKLSSSCYTVQSVKPYVSLNTLLPLHNDLWFIVLGALFRQYKDFQFAKKRL